MVYFCHKRSCAGQLWETAHTQRVRDLFNLGNILPLRTTVNHI